MRLQEILEYAQVTTWLPDNRSALSFQSGYVHALSVGPFLSSYCARAERFGFMCRSLPANRSQLALCEPVQSR